VICFRTKIWAASVAAFFVSCSTQVDHANEDSSFSRGQAVAESSIVFHGGDLFENMDISFHFRNKNYGARRQKGGFAYTNSYEDSAGTHERLLTNNGYYQMLNGAVVELSKKDSISRAASLNSVIYFALIPGLLNTPAALKTYLGTETIEGSPYHKVKVTFTEEGGGEDFDDVFLYWFSTEDYSMDYLAYSYLEDEGGTRFRKAYNQRRVNGLVIQDYINLKGPSPDSLAFISELFNRGKLDTLSLIELDRLSVKKL